MDTYEKNLVEQAIDLIRRAIGHSDSIKDFSPVLTFAKKEEDDKMSNEFTKKEILSMPEKIKKAVEEKFSTNVRKKKNGVYEYRFQHNKKTAYGASKDKKIAKARFLRNLIEVFSEEENTMHATKSVNFREYASKWLDTVRKPIVKETTYSDYCSMFSVHILPAFGKTDLKSIRQFDLQNYFNKLTADGKERSAEKQLQLLNSMFEYAIDDGIIERNPAKNVRLPYHEQTHGQALTKDEERELIEKSLSADTRSGKAFVFILYTGLRRSALATVRIDGAFVEVETAKQRAGHNVKKRLIPISPNLSRIFPDLATVLEEIKDLYPNRLSRYFHELFPEHHLHELRHTFITRAQECGIPREVVSVWAGHKADNTMTSNVYTHFSREYQLKEIEKFDYVL